MLSKKILSLSQSESFRYYKLRFLDTNNRNKAYRASIQYLGLEDEENNQYIPTSILSASTQPPYVVDSVKLNDGNFWLSGGFISLPIDIDIELTQAVKVKRLTIGASPNTDVSGVIVSDGAPNEFSLLGSTDGVSYKEIFYQDNLTFTPLEVKNFDVY